MPLTGCGKRGLNGPTVPLFVARAPAGGHELVTDRITVVYLAMAQTGNWSPVKPK